MYSVEVPNHDPHSKKEKQAAQHQQQEIQMQTENLLLNSPLVRHKGNEQMQIDSNIDLGLLQKSISQGFLDINQRFDTALGHAKDDIILGFKKEIAAEVDKGNGGLISKIVGLRRDHL
jgi:hypothetical protein